MLKERNVSLALPYSEYLGHVVSSERVSPDPTKV